MKSLALLAVLLIAIGCATVPPPDDSGASTGAPEQETDEEPAPAGEGEAGPGPAAPALPDPEGIEPAALPSELELRSQLPAAVRPLRIVQTAGGLPTLIEDLDRKGLPEVLTVAARTTELASEDLADFGALYQADRLPVRFYLVVLSVDELGLNAVARSDLGERLVFGGMRVLPLSPAPEPFAVITSFHNPLGQDHEWRIFDGASIRPVSDFSVRETHGTRLRVEDIDGDRVIDIVVSERALEEGVGYETIMTWYRWQGQRFVPWRIVNVVRNLRSFLEDMRTLLLARDWRGFALHSFSDRQVQELRKSGHSFADIVFKGLALEVYFGDQEVEVPAVLEDVSEVVLPRILEDPFVATDETGDYFLLGLRLVDSAGLSRVVEVPLYMTVNPFVGRQFQIPIR